MAVQTESRKLLAYIIYICWIQATCAANIKVQYFTDIFYDNRNYLFIDNELTIHSE